MFFNRTTTQSSYFFLETQKRGPMDKLHHGRAPNHTTVFAILRPKKRTAPPHAQNRKTPTTSCTTTIFANGTPRDENDEQLQCTRGKKMGRSRIRKLPSMQANCTPLPTKLPDAAPGNLYVQFFSFQQCTTKQNSVSFNKKSKELQQLEEGARYRPLGG